MNITRSRHGKRHSSSPIATDKDMQLSGSHDPKNEQELISVTLHCDSDKEEETANECYSVHLSIEEYERLADFVQRVRQRKAQKV